MAQFKPAPNFRFEVKTDDRGNYRIAGLPSRKYIVQVTLDLMRTITYGVTIAVREPTAKAAQVFKDALQREERKTNPHPQ